MKRELWRRLKKLEHGETEKKAIQRAALESLRAAQQNVSIRLCNYTPAQLVVVRAFNTWFNATFPPVVVTRDRLPFAALTLREYEQLPSVHAYQISHLARLEFERWRSDAGLDTPLPDNQPYNAIVRELRKRIHTEIYLELVPIEERRYFFDPDNLSVDKVIDPPIVHLRIVREPEGDMLKRAFNFAAAWLRHDPTRILAGLPTVADEAKVVETGGKFRPTRAHYEQVPEKWRPPGCGAAA